MYNLVKRVFDIFSSGLAIIVLSPLWIIATIGILISDPGPVFYKAERIGKDNKAFRMLKFRSMKVDKDADEKSFKADTNRIFSFGAFMRNTKLDELPQLINVFLGQMSVIGPRPAAKDQVNITRSGKYAKIADAIPGLSGPSALYDYIYGDTIEDEDEYRKKVLPTRLDLDVYYTKVRSIGYDLKMILYTIVCIVSFLFKKNPQRILNELVENAKSVHTEKEIVNA